jgi:7-carboxy-7-deazaguanine synthase
MAYQVKEIFYTLQGEGSNAGHPAVFCRFAGCNLWSGRALDRAHAACTFCDTDFVGTEGTQGGKYDAASLAHTIASHWPCASQQNRLVVLTGGEPLLQVDSALIDALHQHGFRIAVETNGTVPAPEGLDWVCVSPKASTWQPRATDPFVQRRGHELKVVWPQTGLDLDQLEALDFLAFYLQPMDVADPALRQSHVQLCIQTCLARPKWKLSLQTHKITGIR